VAALALLVTGCESGLQAYPPGGEGGSNQNSSAHGTPSTGAGSVTGTDVADGPCSPEGSQRACHRYLGEHDGIIDCFVGEQTCVGGVWNICEQGDVKHPKRVTHVSAMEVPVEATAESLATLPHVTNLTQGSCNDGGTPLPSCFDPCDPTAGWIDDKPPSGGSTTSTAVGAWKVAPGGKESGASKGWNQPCGAAWDCEYGNYCYYPVTNASCAHDKCSPGGPLVSTCDSCVTAICAQNSACCTGSWDAVNCVQAVHDICGVTCINSTPTCSHDRCATGQALAMGCDSCVTQICSQASTAYCCNSGIGTWDATCAAAVTSVCGIACTPAAKQGQCMEWKPNMTDPQCTKNGGIDLTAGVPCQDPSQGFQPTIPVCNVGTQPVPAGTPVVINVYNPGVGAGTMPNYPPAANSGAKKVCSTASIGSPLIPQGKCVDVPCSTGKDDEIFINPPGPGNVPECNVQNNWTRNLDQSVASPVLCDSPVCSPSNALTWSAPVHVFFSMDRSSNITTSAYNGMKLGMTKWGTTYQSTGYAAFVSVAYSWFPQTNCFGDSSSCTATSTACASGDSHDASWTLLQGMWPNSTSAGLNVPFTIGLGTSEPLATATSFGPYYNALQGALNAARADAVANHAVGQPWKWPYENVVFILGSEPTVNQTCGTNFAAGALAGLAATAYVDPTYPVRTHVIAYDQASMTTAQAIASAGGGSLTMLPAGFTQTQFQTAVNSIVDNGYPCTFNLPPAAQFDPSNTTVTYQVVPALPLPMLQVQDAVHCGALGGWYYIYDAFNNPIQIQLCSNTCSTVKSISPTGVRYNLACPAYYAPATVNGTPYTGTCSEEGTAVEWRWLQYRSSIPNGTSIDFRVSTSTSPTPVSPVTVSSPNSPLQQDCLLGGGNGCPVDLVSALDGSDPAGPAFADTITVGFKLYTNASGSLSPTVNEVYLLYSCPYVQ
jgi:hypothetical protein